MKKSMAAFLQDLFKQNAKRRRAAALFMALSLPLSTSVVWSLHGVGVTLVNEEEDAEAEYHVHSDTCYERYLICDLDEDENHTHQDECYSERLVCGYAEEDPDILIQPVSEDEETISEDEELPDEVIIDSTDEPSITPIEEDPPDEYGPVLLKAPGAGDGPGNPETIETIDNAAEGIHFNLFNYGPELERSCDYGNPPHKNAKKIGINSGRDPLEDIMFFTYGSAPPIENGVHVHDMNYYAGDYRAESYESGNRAFKGIVDDELVNGYPVLSTSGHSLDYLFAPSTSVDGVDQSAYKSVYTDVNYLLKKVENPSGDGHTLVYNSNTNYAYFNEGTNKFEVYDRTFDIINDSHHNKNDVDDCRLDKKKNPIVYSDTVDPGFKIGFFPFNEYNEEFRDPNWNGDGYDHHFGMTMNATFINLPYDGVNVKDPITFKYSGDDDMWVFVDEKLTLDLGGIHEPAGGMIDFTNGLVWSQDNAYGKKLSEVKAQIFADKLVPVDETKGETNDSVWEALPKPIGVDTGSTSSDSGNRWIIEPISNYISNWEDIKNDTHTINMFYLERGGCYSNLAMEINLPTVKPLVVTKDVDYKSHTDPSFDDKEYEFQVYEYVKNETTKEYEWIKPTDFQSHFFLKADGRKQFDNMGRNRVFKVVEIGVDPTIYGSVTINKDSPTVLDTDAPFTDIESSAYSIADTNAYGFKNTVREELEDIPFKKTWQPALSSSDALNNYRVKFKLYRTDSVTGETKPVALRVTDNGKEKIKRTFVLDKNNNWSWKATKLPARYGDHIYTYSVDEVNPPKNYKATYETSADGTLNIINTNQNQSELHVKKEWPHGGEQDDVQIVLKRKRIGYEESEPTALTIEVYDEHKNFIMKKEITAAEKQVFVGGSIEFALDTPEGVEYFVPSAGNEQLSVPLIEPSTVGFTYDDGFFELTNLAEGQNTIRVHVTSGDADDELLEIYHPFSIMANGWVPYGDTRTWNTGNGYYSKNDSLAFGPSEGGTDTSATLSSGEGIMLKLKPGIFKPGKTYTLGAYVKGNTGATYQLIFNDGNGNNKVVASRTISDAGYGTSKPDYVPTLIGSFEMPENYNPYDMSVRIVTTTADKLTKVNVDDFFAVEGDVPVSVKQTSGEITVGSTAKPVTREFYFIQFTDELYDGWKKSGTVSTGGTGEYLRLYDRAKDWCSVEKDFSEILKPGATYKFTLEAQRDGTDGTETVSIVLNYKNASGGNEYQAPVVITFTGADPVTQSGTFTIPENADLSSLRIYFGADDTKSYRILSMRIESTDSEIPGYTLKSTGVYERNYELYDVDFDFDSATNPMKLSDGDYEEDTAFSETATLNEAGEWKTSWTNKDNALNEDSEHYLYQYYVEEVKIGDVDVNAPDSKGRVYSSDGNYLVTYRDMYVPANTKNSPMIVSNKYIWYKLPSTGGIGTGGVCVAGILLTVSSLFGVVVARKREGRDD